ncbi:DUF1353 domain-containing protein [Streptomyces piniterrae]|uniref:DUF1353 domain-containing protein n=1 Tax=Streptomyces piniterrae TaxID=2571125 RepID=A0A4U0NIY8_9ACTN|nr:DUF1353 domain-containing protein [Streptomyces piniterrae]TJZ54245.1 DUF1353 domain-containing protein [Streptomyces piniterrae]
MSRDEGPAAAEKPFTPQPSRFYDGGVDAGKGQKEISPVPGSKARIELVRYADGGGEQFAMQRRIAYDDRHFGELLVPRETRTFRSDLTSVPALFTWLVPKTGEHLPATLLHDGLIHPPGEETYTSSQDRKVLRVEADRVLRDAMADAGTALIRRWLIWSAVATATMLDGGGTDWSKGLRWYYRATAALTVLLILALGSYAFFDLFDVITGTPTLPWMGDRPWFVELVGGLSGAVVIPLVLALFWGPFRIAGAVVGVSLAVLLPVTVALLVPTVIYQVLERMAKAPKVALVLAGVLVVGALAVLLVFSGSVLFR